MDVTDPMAIRALAHPVRLDLLELLVAIGPATAAQCGRVLQLPQANCSFHLRQLAKYGFVDEAEPGPDRRERRYRVTDPRIRIRDEVVASELVSVVAGRAMQAIVDWAKRQAADADWREAGSPLTGVAVMTPAEARDVKQQLRAILEPYFARSIATGPRLKRGERYVRYFLAGTPMAQLDLTGDRGHQNHTNGNEANDA